jgi:hypothetical protein
VRRGRRASAVTAAVGEVVAGSVVVGFCDDGAWSACFGLSLRDLCLYDQASSQRIVRPGGVQLRALTGTGQLPANRNKIARDFLDRTDGEWLFCVDTDMGFSADVVDQLVKAADPELRPVVGALCFAALNPKPPKSAEGLPTHRHGYAERWLIQPTIYVWSEDAGDMGVLPVLDYPRGRIVECSATGAACILIHRTALERIRARYGDEWYDPITHPTALNGGPRTFSEDISFCIRLAAVGLPLHVDTSVKTTHEKGFLFLDETTFDQQMALTRLERELTADADAS